MKKIATTVLIIGGAIIGYWLISPLFINKEVNESLESITSGQEVTDSTVKEESTDKETGINEQKMVDNSTAEVTEPVTLSEGEFQGEAGHSGEGTAKLIENNGQNFVRFEDNFKVTNGTNLYVYLGKDGQYDSETELGELKGNIGSQNYEIPDGIDVSKYNEVWVWCKAFSIAFAKAELAPVN